ncbi:hypothetical protein HQM25_02510 [Microbacterium hominis]|uniref:Biopolymer transporter Tol n=1 Tax=Microbacterium hominis TaxID=162426 RepID=A0A7D4UJF0_9MICO|nr:hypothetical protein HQM25_02510 [Microbacterium hominis]
MGAGRRCRVRVLDARTGETLTVHEDTAVLLEAPNWTVDDQLVLNGDGVLWTMPADGSTAPAVVPIEGLPELNNDHVLAPDGDTVYLSANDGHLYAASLRGGPSRRVTRDAGGRFHFLHGISPDGTRLAYVALDPTEGWDSGTIRTVGVDGADDRAVTGGRGPDDGCEYAPDGAWIYLNTERFSTRPGHAQIARVRPDGSALEQLTADERVNWFPHLTAAGDRAVYLSFPPGTEGHPADREVELKLVDLAASAGAREAWGAASTVVRLFGGQGTINVNSWAPDGHRLAFVDYPVDPGRPATN